MVLEPAVPLADALAGSGGLPGAVMDKVLVDRLGLAVGDTFRLGVQAFRLSAVLLRETAVHATLGYPFLFEPWIATRTQAWGWSAGYVLFVLVCGLLAWTSRSIEVMTASGVEGLGVGTRIRSERNRPSSTSTTAALMPLPPTSTPRSAAGSPGRTGRKRRLPWN